MPPGVGLGSPGVVYHHGVGALILRPFRIRVKGRSVLNHNYGVGRELARVGKATLDFKARPKFRMLRRTV